MKTIKVDLDLYTFDELPDTGRMNAAIHLASLDFDDSFKDIYSLRLFDDFGFDPDMFGDHGLQVQYDFTHSQGSGLNIYGNFNMQDLIDRCCSLAGDFNIDAPGIDDMREVDAFIKMADPANYTAPMNMRYTYSKWDGDTPGDMLWHILTAAEDAGVLEDREDSSLNTPNFYFGEAAGPEYQGKPFTDSKLEESFVKAVECTCFTMNHVCGVLYECGDQLEDWFYEPDAHDGMVYTVDGTYWGTQEELAAVEAEQIEQQGMSDVLAVCNEAAGLTDQNVEKEASIEEVR